MKTKACAFAVVAAAMAFSAYAETNAIPAEAEMEETDDGLEFDAGADLRVRQEIMHNITGLPGAPRAMMPRAYRKNVNHIRFRPRVWASASWENFTLYGRLVDEFREHIVDNGIPRKRRAYNFPDEVALDSLYLDGQGLFDGFLDFRIGRQDMLEGGHSVFGLDRILCDGAPYVGSRSCYADMMKFTFHTTETSKLDAFALYDNGRNIFRYGNHNSRGRPMNAINPSDDPGMDEWGGGLVWHDSLAAKTFPYKVYMVYKHNEAYYAAGRRRVPDKQLTTVGLDLTPQINDMLSLEFDYAEQFGSQGGRQAGGRMCYTGIDFHRSRAEQGLHPFAKASVYYMSGDKHRGGDHDNDIGWDPLWGRCPQDSELFQYGTLYGLGYWSNITYPKLTLGLDIGPHHRVCVYTGPIFAAAQDHAGHADGSGESMFKGELSVVRYDFPILLAPKDASGFKRFEVFGHVMAELFNPGDYYDSSRPAWFLRWELMFKF